MTRAPVWDWLAIFILFAHCLLVRPAQSATQRQIRRDLDNWYQRAGIAAKPRRLLIRIFKKERQLEIWVAPRKGAPYRRVKSYRVCGFSGTLGPKRRCGDGQMPEGIYRVTRFTAHSRFHRSLRINYPNGSDTILGRGGPLGGAILIHGKCVTIGCFPIGDAAIERLFQLSRNVHKRGRAAILVHAYPTRMTAQGVAYLRAIAAGKPKLWRFWRSLVPIYRFFERHHKPARIKVAQDGYYRVAAHE
jgi:murein L,D-transpeptidase YafK